MCKVLMFPTKKLPKFAEERLKEIAKDYVEVLCAPSQVLDIKNKSNAEYEELVELVATTYAEGLIEAFDELEES